MKAVITITAEIDKHQAEMIERINDSARNLENAWYYDFEFLGLNGKHVDWIFEIEEARRQAILNVLESYDEKVTKFTVETED